MKRKFVYERSGVRPSFSNSPARRSRSLSALEMSMGEEIAVRASAARATTPREGPVES